MAVRQFVHQMRWNRGDEDAIISLIHRHGVGQRFHGGAVIDGEDVTSPGGVFEAFLEFEEVLFPLTEQEVHRGVAQVMIKLLEPFGPVFVPQQKRFHGFVAPFFLNWDLQPHGFSLDHEGHVQVLLHIPIIIRLFHLRPQHPVDISRYLNIAH